MSVVAVRSKTVTILFGASSLFGVGGGGGGVLISHGFVK